MGLHCVNDLCGRYLAVLVLEREGLVACMLYGSRLMRGNVCGIRAEYALIRPQDRGNDRGVGLGASFQEMHVCARDAEHFLDAAGGLFAIIVLAITWILFQVGFLDYLEQVGMGPFKIVAVK
jgi:hypothetical protein